MKIETTNILDSNIVNSNDNNSFKILLADGIINLFTPLLYEDIRKKQSQFKININDIKKLKKDTFNEFQKLKKVRKLIEKEKLKEKVLKQIEFLAQVDVIYGSNREIIKRILTTINNQLSSELTKNLEILQKLIKNKIKK